GRGGARPLPRPRLGRARGAAPAGLQAARAARQVGAAPRDGAVSPARRDLPLEDGLRRAAAPLAAPRPRRRRRRRALAGDARAPRPLRPAGRARARAPLLRAARRCGLPYLRDDLHRALVPDVRRPEHPHVGGGLSPTQPGRGDASHERGSRPISVTAGLFGLAGASILLTLGAFEL